MDQLILPIIGTVIIIVVGAVALVAMISVWKDK